MIFALLWEGIKIKIKIKKSVTRHYATRDEAKEGAKLLPPPLGPLDPYLQSLPASLDVLAGRLAGQRVGVLLLLLVKGQVGVHAHAPKERRRRLEL